MHGVEEEVVIGRKAWEEVEGVQDDAVEGTYTEGGYLTCCTFHPSTPPPVLSSLPLPFSKWLKKHKTLMQRPECRENNYTLNNTDLKSVLHLARYQIMNLCLRGSSTVAPLSH